MANILDWGKDGCSIGNSDFRCNENAMIEQRRKKHNE